MKAPLELRALSILAFAAALHVSAALGQIRHPDFDATAEKLDLGGTMYVYMESENAVEGIVAMLDSILKQSGPPQAAIVTPIVRAVLDALGLSQLDDLGFSVIRMDESTYRQKAFLRLKERKGLFALSGGEPGDLNALAWLSPLTSISPSAKRCRWPSRSPLPPRARRARGPSTRAWPNFNCRAAWTPTA